ncbi:MAG: hypothetical protein V1794_11180, partial [Candidatus Glassbacteria bacterium]
MFEASFGHFDRAGTEFVIAEYDTPLPLVNYFWNDRFISGVSQHMAGIGCFTERPMQYMHPETRCLIVRNENRHFYLRDDDTGEYWTPGAYPLIIKPEEFRCRHGLGYSILEARTAGIETVLRVFVPLELETEIWTVKLANRCGRKRRLRFYSFVDWLLTGYQEYCDYYSALKSWWDGSVNALTGHNGAPETPHDRFGAFIASDLAPSGFDSSRRAFLGALGTIGTPRAVLEGRMTGSLAACEKLVGALEHTFELAPGAEVEFNVAIGSTESKEMTAEICRRALAPGAVGKAFDEVVESLTARYGSVRVNTPEEKINYLFNGWIKRSIQLHTEVGTDTGRGFRDVLQAAWGVSSYDPQGARRKIVDSLKHQYAEGHTLRGWNPVDTHHYSDGPVWISPAVDSYLKETGDYAFLDEEVPYFDGGSGTVWDHTLQGLRHATADTGSHGLVRMHYGDWNDSLNMIGTGGRGESVWTSIGIVFAINRALEIVRNVVKDSHLEEDLLQRRDRLTEAIEKSGWDGDWYLEAYNDEGRPVGSRLENEGRIYLNPQTWAIMAGIAGGGRLKKILKAIDNDLECDYGSLVLTPAYKSRNPGIGRITWFVPGMWENASPYCHGTAFKIMADTFIGRGDIAYRSLLKVLPDSPANPS